MYRKLLRDKADALLVTNRVNIAYLSGFSGEGQLLITPGRKILLTDFRFKEQAAQEAKSCQIRQAENFQPPEQNIASLVKKLRLKKLGFESRFMSYNFFHRLTRALWPVKLVPTVDVVEQLRAGKSRQEIKLLKRAACLAVQSFAFAQKLIKPGRREAEVARELEYFMRKQGAQSCAFDPIVASGKRSSLPHAPVSGRRIKENDAVLLDLGCRVSGYNSDLTRMVFLGKMDSKIQRVYRVVLQAQQLAIKAVRAGVKIGQIDKIARQYITKEGLGAFFGHALGHGIGREIHEYPSISPENRAILKAGMVFTVEPGVYIPGKAGVRVEDMVLVTRTGCEVLTK